jgi:hypothetical protein
MSVFFSPFEIRANDFVSKNFFQRIQFPAQNFFRKLFMQEGVAAPADVDTAPGHFVFAKIFPEPLVAMTGLRDQVMEGNKIVATTEHTGFIHHSPPKRNLLGSPVALHLIVEERRCPSNQYQAGQGFHADQVAQVAERFDIAKPKCGEHGERKIATIEQATVEISNQASPTGGSMHLVINQCENPDFQRMTNQGAENAKNNPVLVPDFHFRYECRYTIQEFVMHYHYNGDDQAIYQEHE